MLPVGQRGGDGHLGHVDQVHGCRGSGRNSHSGRVWEGGGRSKPGEVHAFGGGDRTLSRGHNWLLTGKHDAVAARRKSGDGHVEHGSGHQINGLHRAGDAVLTEYRNVHPGVIGRGEQAQRGQSVGAVAAFG